MGFANKHEILMRAVYDKKLAKKISDYADNAYSDQDKKEDDLCSSTEDKNLMMITKFDKDFSFYKEELDYFEATTRKKGIRIRIKLHKPEGCKVTYTEKIIKIPELDKKTKR